MTFMCDSDVLSHVLGKVSEFHNFKGTCARIGGVIIINLTLIIITRKDGEFC